MKLPGYDHIVKQHRPAGYKLARRKMTRLNGYARFERAIVVNRDLKGADALFVFLHECGHVHLRHLCGEGSITTFSRARDEYEADQYAIKAMREAGVAIPRHTLARHKALVGELIAEAKDHEHIEDDVLRYAYGKEWRKHR